MRMAGLVPGKKRKGDFVDAGKVVKKTAVQQIKRKKNGHQSKPADIISAKSDDMLLPMTKPLQNQQTLPLAVQIITGDYEKVTHGLVATIDASALDTEKKDAESGVTFSETFLFAAHTASIRSLAISPEAENGKRFLATGSADERINLYSISTKAPRQKSKSQSTLNGSIIAENTNNKSLGSLNHHDRAVSRLEFPAKGKLFSAAEDNTVAISRTRDWTMLSSIKAPLAKVQGRPSGDTAAPGEVPAGINDFAIHPSQKLMLTISRGERSMRLWNLMTGKKAGVLNFDRVLLAQAGEGKHSSGEGRRVLWDGAGESYVVGFERSAVWYGVDSQPRAVLKPDRPTKLHQYRFFQEHLSEGDSILAVSTENGKILLFDLSKLPQTVSGDKLPVLAPIAEIGSETDGVTARVKDFEMLPLTKIHTSEPQWLVAAASSDGSIWLWNILASQLMEVRDSKKSKSAQSVGTLLARHKTESRITCLGAFILDSSAATEEIVEDEFPEADEDESEEDSDE